MTVRKGYIYALILAVGLLFWTEVWDLWQTPMVPKETPVETTVGSDTAWESAEAVYECAMKAQELKLKLVSMHVAKDSFQGSLKVVGPRKSLQAFYEWLETEGQFRAILSVQLKTDDDSHSTLSVGYQL